MTHIIRLLLLMVSMFSYVFYFSRKIRAEFAIGLVMTGTISLLYIAGILNLLPETAVLIFAGGFVCLFSAIKNKTPLKNVISFGIIAFVIGVIFLFVVLRGNILTHQDDFEHWALVTKLLINENRFPNFSRLSFPHKSYPPGSAVWIYFVLFITGLRAEYVQLLSQAILLLGSLISLFPFAKTTIEKFCTAGIVVLLLLGNNNLRLLLVDQLISLLSLSAVCFCIYYREELKHRLLYIIPWLVSIIAVKTSGALFVFFILILIIPYIGWKRTTATALFTGFMFLLWQKHLRLVFSNSLASRHALSFNWWNQVLSKKNTDNILDTCKLFFQREFSSGNNVYYLLFSGILIFLLCIVFKSEYGKLPKKLILYSIVFYIIYQMGLLAVYIISMPQSEAVDLHAYKRYHLTIMVFDAGVLWIAMLNCIKVLPEKFRLCYSVLPVLFLALLYNGIKPSSSAMRKQVPQDLIRRKAFEQAISGYNINPGKKILILTDVRKSPQNYENTLVTYLCDPAASVHRTLEDYTKNTNIWKSYDYLILPNESDSISSIFRDLFHSEDNVIDLSEMKKIIK